MVLPVALATSPLPEDRCCNASNGFITDPWLPVLQSNPSLACVAGDPILLMSFSQMAILLFFKEKILKLSKLFN